MWISHVASKTLSAHADPTTPAGEDGFSGRLLPRPPTAFPLWQEGRLQRETIEACSGFTCFSACAFAPRLHRGLPRRLQPDDYSSSAAPVATGRTDNSPGGTSTRWPSRPRRSLRNLRLSSRQTSLRVALPGTYSGQYHLAVGSLKASSCTFLSMGRPGHDVVLADLTSFGTRRIT
jgi:hypothetical protein